MSSSSFVKAKSNWVGSVKYKPPTVDKRGGKSVKLVHNGQWLTLQIPLMFSWGVAEYVDESTGVAKYSLSLQFNPEKAMRNIGFWSKLNNYKKRFWMMRSIILRIGLARVR